MSYVYIKSEPGLWTVGHYDPSGKWQPESDHPNTDEAAARVSMLNGCNADRLARAEAQGAGSLLLDVQKECIEWRQKAEVLQAENASLKEALEPFRQAAETIRPDVRDGTSVAYIAYDLAQPGRKTIGLLTAADFRRALSALTQKGNSNV